MKKLMLAVVMVGLGSLNASAELVSYYIGRDLRETIPTGPYAGLANPNYNRLTLLYAHTYELTPEINHYHSKSTYTYFGPNLGAATAVQPFNGTAAGEPRNYLPETAGGRIVLLPGSGVFAGQFVSGLTPGVEYADLRIKSVDSLAGFPDGSPENILWKSGGNQPVGRWAGSMAGSRITLVLVEASAGLVVADALGNTILSNPGDVYELGDGGVGLDFTPIFAANRLGQHYAVFKLVDSGTGNDGGPWGESGLFRYNMRAAVPEPGSLVLALGGLGTAGLLAGRRRRRVRVVR
ncbi:MAG: hypothetical protein KatS3mg108_1489 [Isosphaeraceae bacterium]|jgi:hypothetical protein|nr:MAG: hypothetical protein KatS3mg108_1489 [Isosphaeraceae bacterium]